MSACLRPARALAIALIVSGSSAAGAQQLVAVGEDGVPFALEGPAAAPVVDPGALTFFARDLGANAMRALRIDARGVRVDPAGDAVSVAACGATRWLLGFESHGARARWSLRAEGAPELWSRAISTSDFEMVRLDCAGAAPVLGWIERGELVTVSLGTSPGAVPAVSRVRVLPATERADVEWRRAPTGEIFAAVSVWSPRSAELLRIAGGVVTHRAPLGVASSIVLALSPDRILVARTIAPDARLAFSSFAAADLSPGRDTPLPPTADRRGVVHCAWLAAGPAGRVVLALVESWQGPDWVSIAQGPNEPARQEPAYHSTVALRLWETRTGRIGPALPLGSRYAGAGAWLGEQFVLVTPVESDGVVAGVVQLRAARVRRFALRAP